MLGTSARLVCTSAEAFPTAALAATSATRRVGVRARAEALVAPWNCAAGSKTSTPCRCKRLRRRPVPPADRRRLRRSPPRRRLGPRPLWERAVRAQFAVRYVGGYCSTAAAALAGGLDVAAIDRVRPRHDRGRFLAPERLTGAGCSRRFTRRAHEFSHAKIAFERKIADYAYGPASSDPSACGPPTGRRPALAYAAQLGSVFKDRRVLDHGQVLRRHELTDHEWKLLAPPIPPHRPGPTALHARPRRSRQGLQLPRLPRLPTETGHRTHHPREGGTTTASLHPRPPRRQTTRIRPADLPSTQHDRALLQSAQGLPRHCHPIRKDCHLLRGSGHSRVIRALAKIRSKTDPRPLTWAFAWAADEAVAQILGCVGRSECRGAGWQGAASALERGSRSRGRCHSRNCASSTSSAIGLVACQGGDLFERPGSRRGSYPGQFSCGTAISPRRDQSSWGTVTFTMRGVSAR